METVVLPGETHDPAQWKVHTRVDKYDGDWSAEDIDAGLAVKALFETVEDEGNLLLIGGSSVLWQTLIGNGTATAAQALTYFNNTNARIGVGDSSTAEVSTQTGLVASTNKAFQAMDATYPLHTDTTGTVGSQTITFRATFGTSAANYVWAEWTIDNGTRTLNRKVAANGTKASGSTWQFTVTITIS